MPLAAPALRTLRSRGPDETPRAIETPSDGEGGFISRRIAFVNEKGGSAKTTLVANLAAYYALRRGRRVLALDLDPQGQLGKALGVDVHGARRSALDLVVSALLDPSSLDDPPPAPAADGDLPLTHTRIEGLDLVVANKSLALHAGWEAGDDDPTDRLRRRLVGSPRVRAYDFVLMDAPPSFGPLTLNVLRAADELVVPVPLTFLALDGCAELLRTLRTVRSRFGHPGLRVSMVVPTFYRRTRLAHEVLESLKQRFPKEICSTVLGYHVRIDEAQSRGLSIFEYAPRDRGARALAAIAEELEARAPAAAPEASA
jgi:chromosome partitioning protein